MNAVPALPGRRGLRTAGDGGGGLSWRGMTGRPTPLFERAVAPPRGVLLRRRRDGLPLSAFRLLALAVLARMVLSPDLLWTLGFNYGGAAGNPLGKIHIGTYLMVLALWVYLVEHGAPMQRLLRHFYHHRAHAAFMVMTALCIPYALLNHLSGYQSVFTDNFLCAGAAAILLSAASAPQLRALARLLLCVLCVNAALAVWETMRQVHLVPQVPIDGLVAPDRPGEFRGNGLAGSSLEAAMEGEIGIFLLLGMRLPLSRTVPLLLLLLLGLVSYGGRTALLVTCAVLGVTGFGYLVREAAARRLKAEAVGVAFITIAVMPALLLFVVTATPMGQRIANTLFLDHSAEIRNIAFDILGMLPTGNLLFGTSDDVTLALCKELGLPVPYADLENPWLALFVSLGAVGFTLFMIGFVPFLLDLWRRASLSHSKVWGRIMLLSFLLVATTSNSFGRKSPLLVVLTVAIYALAAAPAYSAIRRRRQRVKRRVRPAAGRGWVGGVAASPQAARPVVRREPSLGRP